MPVPKAELMRRLRERRRAERLAARSERACVVCSKALPVEARADTACCSAICRARLSRKTISAMALNEGEIVELHAALASFLAEVPSGEEQIVTGRGLRFFVTKVGDGFHVEERKRRRWLLSAHYRADGTADRYLKDPRRERAVYRLMCR